MARMLCILAILILDASSAAEAGSLPTQDVAQQPIGEPSTAAEAAGPTPQVSPMMQEIFTLWEAEQSRLPRLYQQFAAATSEAEALAIQKQIEELKRTTERDVLRIQLRYAREAGRADTVTRIEKALKVMDMQPSLAP